MLTKIITCDRPACAVRSSLRRVAAFSAGLLAASLNVGAAGAQEWPSRPVRVIVPLGPGGVADTQARLTAERLSRVLGQPFIVENRAAGSGFVGTETAVRSAADGYTLFFTGASLYFGLPRMQKVSFDLSNDLTPITVVGSNPAALTVVADSQFKSLPDLVAFARANPGKISYSIGSGLGNFTHLTAAALAARERLDMVMVPFPNGPAAVTAVLSKNVDFYFANSSDVYEQARAGKVRLLAVSSDKRVSQFADIPTVSETTPGFEMSTWNGYFAPAGTPRPIIDKIAKLVAEMCREPDFIKKLEVLGIDALGSLPDETTAMIQKDQPIFASAFDAAGLKRPQ